MDGNIGPAFEYGVLDFSSKDTLAGNSGERNIVLTITCCNDLDDFTRRTEKFESACDFRGLGKGQR
jgi:hypothetical protein